MQDQDKTQAQLIAELRQRVAELETAEAERKRAEEALRVVLTKYETLFDSFPLGITVSDQAGKILESNPMAERLLGVPQEEQIQRAIDGEEWRVVRTDGTPMPPDEFASVRALRENRLVENVEMGIVKDKGDITWISVTAAPIPLESYGVAIAYGDITARKQAENELSKFKTISDKAGYGITIVDLEGNVSYVNASFARMHGYTPDEVIGKHLSTFHTEKQMANVNRLIEQLNREGNYVAEEVWHKRNDNSEFPTLMTGTLIKDANGTPLIMAGTAIDITERKRAEEALRESEERFREIVENAPFGYYRVGKDGLWQYVNPEWEHMHGYSLEDVVGKSFEMTQPDDAKEQAREYVRLVLAGEAMTGEFGRRLRNGSIEYHSFNIQPVRQHGEIVAIEGFINDVTERKRAEDEIRQLNAELEQRVAERTVELSAANAELAHAARLKDEFLAAMSHELRTPLTAILGMSESLQEGTYGPLNEKQLKSLRTIEASGRPLLALISDILDLAKIGAGKVELQIEPVSVESVCQASLQFVKQDAHKKHLQVSRSLDSAVTTVQVDARRLKQILVNLLSNAVKFTPEGGQIGLEVVGDTERQVVCFEVWDTGIGIAPEDAQRLFQPFVQLDARLSRRYSGTGLGLALVRQLTEMHGGSVSVESEGVPGKGSRFIVSLPWQAESGTKLPGNQGAEEPFHSVTLLLGRPVKVLLAEDNESNLSVMVDYLQSKDYQVVIAEDGHQAIERAKAERPDMIIMDVQMPGMDGLDAIRRIRAEADLAAVPIIAMTGLAMPGDDVRCLEAGANDYLTKPVSLKVLLSTLQALLKPATACK